MASVQVDVQLQWVVLVASGLGRNDLRATSLFSPTAPFSRCDDALAARVRLADRCTPCQQPEPCAWLNVSAREAKSHSFWIEFLAIMGICCSRSQMGSHSSVFLGPAISLCVTSVEPCHKNCCAITTVWDLFCTHFRWTEFRIRNNYHRAVPRYTTYR